MKTEKRTLPEFSGTSFGGAYEVTIETGKTESSVTITGDDNLVPLVLTEVKDGVLTVHSKESLSPSKTITLLVTMKEMTSLHCSGAGKIAAKDLKTAQLKLSFSGAADFVGTGEVDQLDVQVSGAGNLDAKDLKAKTVTVSMSGAGNASLHASAELNASISGVGNVDYYGNPPKVTPKISGLGKISKKD